MFFAGWQKKPSYIILIVLICGISILISAGYGINEILNPSLENQSENHMSSITPATTPPTIEEETAPGRNCSQNKDCSSNERCRKNDDNSSFCYCLPRFRRNNSTQECELKYQWVKYTAELFNDTRLVDPENFSGGGFSSVVARLMYDNGDTVLVDGLINPSHNGSILPFTPISENATDIEVLLIESGDIKWIESSNGIVEKNAIEGGNIGNETVYVCRIYDNYDHHVGEMQPSNRSCHEQYYNEYHQIYSLLTLLK